MRGAVQRNCPFCSRRLERGASHTLIAALTLSSIALRGPAAQAPVIIRLKPADAKLAEEFTGVEYVRELANRGILVADAREQHLVFANFASGTVVPVSRSGSGPGEFRSIGGLFALAADSTLLVDTRTAGHEDTRYDLVDRRGALVGQIQLPGSETIVGFGLQSVFVVLTDNDGIQRLQRHPWP
jgi:hypothetical protein